MFGILNDLFQPRGERVSFDETGVTRTMSNGRTEAIAWDAVVEIGIVTTDEGPFREDCWWLLIGEQGGAAIPNGADGFKDLLAELQRRFPGFDNEAVIAAMGSIENDSFRIWVRPAA